MDASCGKVKRGAPDLMPLPAIIHQDRPQEHFVVLYRLRRRRARIADPAWGPRWVSRASFESQWSGYAVLLAPGPGFLRLKRRRRSFAFVRLCARERQALLLAALMGLVVSIAGFASSLIAKEVFDRVLPGSAVALLPVLWAAAVGLALATAAGAVARAKVLTKLGLYAEMRMGCGFTARVFRREIEFFLHHSAGELYSRFSDVTAVQAAMTGVVMSVLFDAVSLLGCLLVLFFYCPALTSAALPFLALGVGCAWAASGPLLGMERRARVASSGFAARFVEFASNIRTIKAFSAEPGVIAGLTKHYRRARQAAADRNFAYQSAGAGVALATGLGAAAVLLSGASMVGHRVITAVGLVLFDTGIGLILGPVQRLAPSVASLQAGLVGLERLSVAGEAGPGLIERGVEWPREVRGCIDLEGISFWYREETSVLRDLSLHIEAGMVLAMVGPTGCGKTTLAQIVAGMLRPSAGTIYLDGEPLSLYRPSSVRKKFALLAQDAGLVAGTVRENISLGSPSATLEDVIRAAEQSGAAGFIDRLPRRYDQGVGAFGAALSSGQRQRLALARAFLRDAPVLILDEATNALDPATEDETLRRLLAARRGRTTIVITHRWPVATLAESVAYVEHGRIAGLGSHAELLARVDGYRDLWGGQFWGPASLGA